jgi:thermitase
MKKALALLLLLLASPALAADYASDRVIVRRAHEPRGRVEKVERGRVEEALARLRSDPQVLWAEPDYIVHATAIPNDPFAPGNQYALPLMQVYTAHDVSQGSGVLVAVIDTGVARTHPDLAPQMWTNPGELLDGVDNDGNGFVDDVHGWDFYSDDADPRDEQYHGTHVAGIVAAATNNGIGVASVAPGARVMALRFLGPCGSGFTSDAVRAIDYAVAQGARVLNNSWGGGSFSQALFDSIAAANAAGVLFVASAGNNGSQISDACTFYPACYQVPNIVSVASTDAQDVRSSFSNYGPGADLAAPGTLIYSTFICGKEFAPCYGYLSGTSMAAPQVSGVAALVLAGESLSPSALKARLMDTVDLLPQLATVSVSGGRLNAARAVGAPPVEPGPVCGNDTCEPSETCQTCFDCGGKSKGKPSLRFCCGDGVQQPAETEARCDGNF